MLNLFLRNVTIQYNLCKGAHFDFHWLQYALHQITLKILGENPQMSSQTKYKINFCPYLKMACINQLLLVCSVFYKVISLGNCTHIFQETSAYFCDIFNKVDGTVNFILLLAQIHLKIQQSRINCRITCTQTSFC